MISKDLLDTLLEFRSERDWEQFHNLRTLSTSIMLEAAELAEITQWARDSELAGIASGRRKHIEEEVADLVILLSYLAHDAGIDLDAAVRKKVASNALKYPVEKSKGIARKYDDLD